MLRIIYKAPAQLKARAVNPRTHTKKQIKQVAGSIAEFGFINPVLIDAADEIVAGHARTEAAKVLGMSDIPTVRVDHLTPAQIRAYVIADNRLAENAGWDKRLLAIELQELSVELNFDITITGFETAESDILISEIVEQELDQDDDIPDIDRSSPAISKPGDRWLIGDHVLLCGDALLKETYGSLLGSKRAQMVFSDPPYNLPIAGNVSGLGKAKHREFAMASGEMSQLEFIRFLQTAFERLTAFSSNGSIHFICMDWRHIFEVMEAASKPYTEFKNLCVWTKTNAGMGSLYRSQHELIFVMKNGTAPHINNVELGRFGRNRTNVWPYAGMTSISQNRDAELAMHPTVKPLALVADAILDCSNRGGIVLDNFAGSGTTLLAAQKTGRRGFGIELDPFYVDVAIRRFAETHGIPATLSDSKLNFEMVRNQRSVSGAKANGKKS